MQEKKKKKILRTSQAFIYTLSIAKPSIDSPTSEYYIHTALLCITFNCIPYLVILVTVLFDLFQSYLSAHQFISYTLTCFLYFYEVPQRNVLCPTELSKLMLYIFCASVHGLNMSDQCQMNLKPPKLL